MARLLFDTTVSGATAVVALKGELDLSGAGDLESELERLGAEPGVQTVVLDLRRLDFLDSSGLRLMSVSDRRLADAERRLVLVRGSHTVQRVFDITRMTSRLTFVDTPDEAVAGERP